MPEMSRPYTHHPPRFAGLGFGCQHHTLALRNPQMNNMAKAAQITNRKSIRIGALSHCFPWNGRKNYRAQIRPLCNASPTIVA